MLFKVKLLLTLYILPESIKNVCKWYKQSFSQIRSFPIPVDSEKEAAFAKLLSSINERHSYSLITMAKGAHEIRTLLGQDLDTFAEHHDIQRRIDDFYLSRIGIKMVKIINLSPLQKL